MRPIDVIAWEIFHCWRPTPAARPYLYAMTEITSIDQMYYSDSARDIVNRFLLNAGTWRGEEARRIKAELKEMLK